MTDLKQAAQMALDALETLIPTKNPSVYDSAIEALRAALAAPQPEPVPHAVIAGALFDFMGWLTTRKERFVLSSTDNASPAVESITEFAKMRGLSLDDAKVRDWNTAPPERQPLTDEQMREALRQCPYDTMDVLRVRWLYVKDFARAIEKAHGIGGDK